MDPREIFGQNQNQKGKKHFVFKLKINIWTVLLGILFVLFFLPLAISFVELSREEGKVARSVELASALVLLLGIATVAVVAGYFLKNTAQMLRYFFRISATGELSGELVQAFFGYFLRLVAPVLIVAFVAAFLGNVLQVGFLFSVKPITPDVNRIMPNLGRFFRRALFSGEAAFNLAKNILKIAVVFVIAYLNVRGELTRILRLGDSSWQQGFRLIAAISLRIIVESAIAMLVLAVPDYMFARRQHLESLKMSRQEIKEERRMYEGDPLVRSRLREKMRELLTRNMLKAVPRADVIITNPTHYAVALDWEREHRFARGGPDASVAVEKDDGSRIEGRGFEADFRTHTIRFTSGVSGTVVTEEKGETP